MRLIAGLLLPALLSTPLLAACSGDGSEPAEPTAAPPASPTPADGPVADLHMVCSGEGSPTIVLIAGLDTSGDTFEDVQDRLAPTARTCWYDRAGIGDSHQLADDAPDPSPGSATADLRASLAAQGIDPPYVVLGWSYGGLVAQAYAEAYPEDLAGLVLEDTSVREQFTDPELVDDTLEVREGGRDVDTEALQEQVADVRLGDLPVAVLSQDEARGKFRRLWLGYHDDLARSSSDGIHVVGIGSGHVMHEDVPDLLVASVEAVWTAAAQGSALGRCDARFTDAGGRCRAV
jgi:pimeloyl-ACP methyl ester carboxylesterase